MRDSRPIGCLIESRRWNMQPFTIRTANREDAPTIYTIHHASLITLCVSHYSLDTLQCWFSGKTVEGYYLAIDDGEMFVCELNKVVIGFGHAVPGEVVAIFVHPDFAGQGVGNCLLSYAIQCASKDYDGPIKLIATLNAEPFYARHGFSEVRRYTLERGDLQFPVVEMELDAGKHN